MSNLILVRHGQSEWNLENRFTGWKDVPLTDQGKEEANMQFNLLNKKIGMAIIKVCNQIINLKLLDEFPLAVWQTGSGTHTNMNANEVICNYAIKSLKGKIGSKNPVHPNDHVNLSQSSNDTFPTVMHIAINELVDAKLIPTVNLFLRELESKSNKFNRIIKY